MEPEDSLLCSGNLTAVSCFADHKSVPYSHAVGHWGTFFCQILRYGRWIWWSHTFSAPILHQRLYWSVSQYIPPKCNNKSGLTFTGPCIVIYFYSKTNQMHQCIKFILFWNNSTCFGRSFRPSPAVKDCTYSNRHMSNKYCCLLASKQTAVSLWHIPVAVCTVLNCWSSAIQGTVQYSKIPWTQ